MKLITKKIEKDAPALYSTEDVPLDEKKIVAKFFTPWTNWTWYMVEYDPKTRTAFGLVDGHYKEFGNFSIDELESITGPSGLKIERDRNFSGKTIKDVR